MGLSKSVRDFNDNGSIDGFDTAATNFSNQLDRYLNSRQDNAAAFQTSAQNLKTASDQLLRDLNAVNQKAFQLGQAAPWPWPSRWEYKAAVSVSNETLRASPPMWRKAT